MIEVSRRLAIFELLKRREVQNMIFEGYAQAVELRYHRVVSQISKCGCGEDRSIHQEGQQASKSEAYYYC